MTMEHHRYHDLYKNGAWTMWLRIPLITERWRTTFCIHTFVFLLLTVLGNQRPRWVCFQFIHPGLIRNNQFVLFISSHPVQLKTLFPRSTKEHEILTLHRYCLIYWVFSVFPSLIIEELDTSGILEFAILSFIFGILASSLIRDKFELSTLCRYWQW